MSNKRKKTKLSVEIYGQKYTIVGEEDPTHIRRVANIVDNKMREIKERNPFLDLQKLAVLTAVNIADEACKLDKKVKQLEEKMKQIEDEQIND
ncbi:cell division protein ZapA [Massilibacterium senegalense]|uniref:cell division protein ZapA n=1 Tax=Massilibacterium senegalense TaxID=1632858 RepID=UPI000782ABEB|nr:cell division protein ZapA [Massilibacterium senegalense]